MDPLNTFCHFGLEREITKDAQDQEGIIIFQEHFFRYHQTNEYFEQRHIREEREGALAQNLIILWGQF